MRVALRWEVFAYRQTVPFNSAYFVLRETQYARALLVLSLSYFVFVPPRCRDTTTNDESKIAALLTCSVCCST